MFLLSHQERIFGLPRRETTLVEGALMRDFPGGLVGEADMFSDFGL